jgi:K+/H+ antiporter YhaU regulatory subunit KhtT
MAGIITVILILIFSILLTRVASIALTHTGLSKESSKFQARSAFTGVGFTTDESEKVVNHPVRRRILLLLMILGNAGIVTGIASLIIGFSGIEEKVDTWIKIVVLLGGVIILWYLANSKWVDRRLSVVINRILKKYTRLDLNDYASLLQLSGEFRISEIHVECDHWLCEKKLKNTRLREEGLNVLAISRSDGTFLGTPGGNTQIQEDDSLIIYGRATAINKLENRLKGQRGNKQHKAMIREQEKVQKEELKEDTEKEN